MKLKGGEKRNRKEKMFTAKKSKEKTALATKNSGTV